jgi:hypothetical protein
MKKLIFASLLAFSVSSHAEFISGNKLMSLIQSEVSSEKTFAYGYVAGVFDLGYGTTHCAPDNVTIKQITDMTLKLLQTVPEMRERSGDQFVNAVISKTWPCKKQSSSKGTQV